MQSFDCKSCKIRVPSKTMSSDYSTVLLKLNNVTVGMYCYRHTIIRLEIEYYFLFILFTENLLSNFSFFLSNKKNVLTKSNFFLCQSKKDDLMFRYYIFYGKNIPFTKQNLSSLKKKCKIVLYFKNIFAYVKNVYVFKFYINVPT